MQVKLFCFPHAGASSALFNTWKSRFPTEIQLVSLDYPGHGSRYDEPLLSNIDELVQYLFDQIITNLSTPYLFYGHSLGTLVSFELIRKLRRQNIMLPAHLIVSGRHAPQVSSANSWLHQLPDTEFVQKIQEKYSGIPTILIENPAMLALFIPIIRADLTIVETYKYKQEPPLSCPITVIRGDSDHLINDTGLAAWREQTHKTYNSISLAGDHFSLLTNHELTQLLINIANAHYKGTK